MLAPGSVLTKRPPGWVVVADLVETSRLFGRTAARIDPATVERVAEHLVQRSYSEPHWEAKRGEVVAFERVTLYGLTLVRAAPRRLRDNRTRARPGTVHQARAGRGRLADPAPLLPRQRALLAELAELEERARRRDLLVGDDEIYALYDARIPADVGVGAALRRVVEEATAPHAGPAHVHPRRPAARRGRRRPARQLAHRRRSTLPLSYRFEPTAADDGVTVHVPVDVLARLGGDEFAWHVPALREELVTALIKSLPKQLRRNFVPAPDTARAVLADLDPDREPLLDGLQRELLRRTGVRVPIDEFDLDKLPAHLRVTFVVESTDGGNWAAARTSSALQERLAAPARMPSRRRSPTGSERTGLRGWPDDLAELPRTVERQPRAHASAASGVRRRGWRGRRAGVRDRGRAGGGDGPGHPPAAAAGCAVAGESR